MSEQAIQPDYEAYRYQMRRNNPIHQDAIDAACVPLCAEIERLQNKLCTAELAASGAQQLREFAELALANHLASATDA